MILDKGILSWVFSGQFWCVWTVCGLNHGSWERDYKEQATNLYLCLYLFKWAKRCRAIFGYPPLYHKRLTICEYSTAASSIVVSKPNKSHVNLQIDIIRFQWKKGIIFFRHNTRVILLLWLSQCSWRKWLRWYIPVLIFFQDRGILSKSHKDLYAIRFELVTILNDYKIQISSNTEPV